ncbi:MAG TPA: Uma2 family endonuclease [Dehalococcoidia bacterium]|nr:Uma2 family endonuclease [Dehalococcoidia bacterium]
MVTEKTLLTAEDLYQLANGGCRYELHQGELGEMTPPGGPHGTIQLRIGRLLGNFVEDEGLNFIVGVESGSSCSADPITFSAPMSTL